MSINGSDCAPGNLYAFNKVKYIEIKLFAKIFILLLR